MKTRSILRAVVIGVAAILLLAPATLADTCCANTRVGLTPHATRPGDAVRLTGLRCLHADNSGGLPLRLGSFWLWRGHRAADAAPDTAPGPGLPQDLPPVERWLPFDSVDVAAASAVITVPDLPDGTYQLWWWCDDGSGPGGGIHYSTGPRLAIGATPDTATAGVVAPETTGDPALRAWLFLAVAASVLVVTLRHPFGRDARRARSQRSGA
jgi:hypothetical protein